MMKGIIGRQAYTIYGACLLSCFWVGRDISHNKDDDDLILEQPF